MYHSCMHDGLQKQKTTFKRMKKVVRNRPGRMLDTDYKDPIISAMTPCAFLDDLFSRLVRRGIVDRSTSQGRSVLDLGKGFFSASCRRGRSAGQ